MGKGKNKLQLVIAYVPVFALDSLDKSLTSLHNLHHRFIYIYVSSCFALEGLHREKNIVKGVIIAGIDAAHPIKLLLERSNCTQ